MIGNQLPLQADPFQKLKRIMECLSVVFATNQFHEYCYGRHFDVLNDRKPLQGIFSKPLINAPPKT